MEVYEGPLVTWKRIGTYVDSGEWKINGPRKDGFLIWSERSRSGCPHPSKTFLSQNIVPDEVKCNLPSLTPPRTQMVLSNPLFRSLNSRGETFHLEDNDTPKKWTVPVP